MRDVFYKAVTDEDTDNTIKAQYRAFKQVLIHDMSEEDFADVYSQTITYGLFTARLHDKTLDTFSRAESYELMPKSNPFLRNLFLYVANDLDERVRWVVDALCEVYRATNIRDILKDFGRTTGRNDPIVHFYETFLSIYDKGARKDRGVWYTPEAVVNFIIRGVDEVLKTHFNLPDGIADTSKVKIKMKEKDSKLKSGVREYEKEVHKVQLLDVATGTGTFIAEVIKQVYAKFEGQDGIWSSYVDEHLLPRLHGFEILMASYAMCHMKIDLLLNETGYKTKKPNNPPRLSVYLTNSLEEHHTDVDTLFASWLSKEANEASYIKRDIPVMVAFGNPPYNVSSQNKGAWITSLTADYKKNLNERNINSLSDDYIKFIRYAEHYIERNGYGVVAMITNNSFFDGITHRQMRKHLLETFDKIYIYDLHGNAKKKETAPDGKPDKNVFNIMQGVGISIMIKNKPKNKELAEVWHYDSYGKKDDKYTRLFEQSLATTPFKRLEYKEPYYFFVPKDFGEEEEYKKGFGVNGLLILGASGIKTERDDLVIQFDEKSLLKIKEDFIALEPEEFRTLYKERKDGRDWQISTAKKDITNNSPKLIDVLYRPFDFRKTFYTGKTKGIHAYPRNEIMQHVINGRNVGLLCSRQANLGFKHAFIAKELVDINLLASAGLFGGGMFFPLYLYPTKSEQSSLLDTTTRKPNLDTAIVKQIAKTLALKFIPDHEARDAGKEGTFTPLDLLDYIYATLHSPAYREKYKEFLKIDFPRVPYPTNSDSFWQLVKLGSELRALHLMESPLLAKLSTRFPENGSNIVDKITFTPDSANPTIGKVNINHEQYFDNVPLIAWNFYIGGYQPAQKWLKDRKTRTLSFDDILHWQKIVVALLNTDRIMKEIDNISAGA